MDRIGIRESFENFYKDHKMERCWWIGLRVRYTYQGETSNGYMIWYNVASDSGKFVYGYCMVGGSE